MTAVVKQNRKTYEYIRNKRKHCSRICALYRRVVRVSRKRRVPRLSVVPRVSRPPVCGADEVHAPATCRLLRPGVRRGLSVAWRGAYVSRAVLPSARGRRGKQVRMREAARGRVPSRDRLVFLLRPHTSAADPRPAQPPTHPRSRCFYCDSFLPHLAALFTAAAAVFRRPLPCANDVLHRLPIFAD
ncbi:Protein of unknown function [Gryllus bimaculatus]|nr:Protein of unknown function [Gryllus bimaculatus]